MNEKFIATHKQKTVWLENDEAAALDRLLKAKGLTYAEFIKRGAFALSKGRLDKAE